MVIAAPDGGCSDRYSAVRLHALLLAVACLATLLLAALWPGAASAASASSAVTTAHHTPHVTSHAHGDMAAVKMSIGAHSHDDCGQDQADHCCHTHVVDAHLAPLVQRGVNLAIVLSAPDIAGPSREAPPLRRPPRV